MLPGAGPPVPPPAAPPTSAPVAPGLPPGVQPPLPLSQDDLTFWRSEIERAEKLRTDTIAAWDVEGNLERYTPRSVKAGDGGGVTLDVNVAKDFSDVERKKAALFYDTPTVALVPDQGTPSVELLLMQELINAMLGPKRMKSKSMAMATIQ